MLGVFLTSNAMYVRSNALNNMSALYPGDAGFNTSGYASSSDKPVSTFARKVPGTKAEYDDWIRGLMLAEDARYTMPAGN